MSQEVLPGDMWEVGATCSVIGCCMPPGSSKHKEVGTEHSFVHVGMNLPGRTSANRVTGHFRAY